MVIAKKGLAAISVEDVAEHAGYTRGAFYSNFESKAELFVELLERDHANIQQHLQQLMDTDISADDLKKQLTTFYSQCYSDHISYVLRTEARLLAGRDAKFRQRMKVLQLETRDRVAYVIGQLCFRMGISPPAPAPDVALAMMALIEGMLCFNMCMPGETPDSTVESMLGTFFHATLFGDGATKE
jgi:AcrR family transcriptional regulator